MSSPKVLSLTELASTVRAAQAAGERVVHCHGCFDLVHPGHVHPGHVRHLQWAARQGDRLVVTVTADAVMNKGVGRPLFPEGMRAENLAALDCVDWVAINPDETAVELLRLVRPDQYVKGREYEHNHDPRFESEKAVVEAHGGRVVFSSGDVVFSSTALIQAMEDSADPAQARVRTLLRQHELTVDALARLVGAFRDREILVVGDVIIDTYVLCDRPAVAGESPVMTLRPVEHRRFDGGAAIIARHLAAMGARPTLLTVLPESADAESLRFRLAAEGVRVRWLETSGDLIEKQRFLVGTNKVMKLDLGEPANLDATQQRRLIDLATEFGGSSDGVILADFGQGLFSAASMERLCDTLRPRVPFLAGDVSGRRSNLRAMRGLDLITPSESEIRDALHDYDSGLSLVVWKTLEDTASRAAIATIGGEGLIAFERNADAHLQPEDWRTRLRAEHVPALAPFAVDQLGCGDALLSSAALAMVSGGSLVAGALLGSIAAAVEAQRLGNIPITAADLLQGLRRLGGCHLAVASDAMALAT